LKTGGHAIPSVGELESGPHVSVAVGRACLLAAEVVLLNQAELAGARANELISPRFSGDAFLESSGLQRGGSNAQQVSGRDPQAGRGVRPLRYEGRAAVRHVRMTQASIYSWPKQDSFSPM